MGIGDKLAKSGTRKWVIGCSALVLLSCAGLGAVVLQVVDFPVVAMRSDKVAAEYRAAGLPWEASDIVPKFEPADNADPAFLAEMEKVSRWPGSGMKAVEDAMNLYDYAVAARELKALEPEIAKFEAASQAKIIYFEKEWDLGGYALFPEYAKFKTAVKLLTWRAEVKAKNGDLDGGLEDLKTSYRLGNRIGEGNILISMLVGIACHAITARAAENVAAINPGDADWIQRVRDEVATWESSLEFETALRGEAYMLMSMVRNIDDRHLYFINLNSEVPKPRPEKLIRSGFGVGTVRRAYQTRVMESYIDLQKIYTDQSVPLPEMGKRIDDYLRSGIKRGRMSDRIVDYAFPIFNQAGFALAKDLCLTQMLDVVLRAAQYKAKHGKFPTSWAELGGAQVKDVVGNELMKLKVVDGVFVIYSVGPNGVDDGGFDGKFRTGDDFFVQYPPKPRVALGAIPGVAPGTLELGK